MVNVIGCDRIVVMKTIRICSAEHFLRGSRICTACGEVQSSASMASFATAAGKRCTSRTAGCRLPSEYNRRSRQITTLSPTSDTFSSKSSSPANLPSLPSLPALLTSFHSCLLHLQHVTMFSVPCPVLTDMPVGMYLCVGPSFLIPFLLILGINLRSRSFMYNDHLPPV